MFIGHAAVALAAKPRVPGRSLGVLMAAAYLIDLVWPVLLLLGVESVVIRPGDTAFTPLSFVNYPWSHSLIAVLVWSLVVLLVLIWAPGPFSPPPPSQTAIGVVGLAMWLIPLWAHWADRHRQCARQQP